MDWFPIPLPKFLIDVLDELEDFILVPPVYGHSLTRWHKKRQERYPAMQLRMLLKHESVSLKPLYNVLC